MFLEKATENTLIIYQNIMSLVLTRTGPVIELYDMPESREVPNFTGADANQWDYFLKIRTDVLKALEEARNEKIIGKPLEARIVIVPKDEETKTVLEHTPNIHQLFIVSEAEIADEYSGTKSYQYVDVFVEKHPGEKCDRCWMHADSVGQFEDHPTLCERCHDVVVNHYQG